MRLRSLTFLLLLLSLITPVAAQTQLYLHATTASIAGYKDMTLSLGAGSVNLVTNTTAGGTDIQVTNTGGGTAQAWISPALVTGFTLSGTVTCNVYGGQSANTANTALRCRLYKYSGGAEGAAILTANMTTELNTTLTTVRNWTGTPTSTAFAAGDRLVLKLFLENCATSGCPTGTMAAGATVTLHYDGATVGADGATWVQATETLDFGVDITSNLVAKYSFSTGSGSTAFDTSGNALNGTLINSPSWACTQIDSCLTFTAASSQYVSIANNALLNITGNLTLAAWMKTTSGGAYIFGSDGYPAGFAWCLGCDSGGVNFITGGAAWINADSGFMDDGTWKHIAVTLSGTTATFYLNGVTDGGGSTPAPTSYTGTRTIGADTTGAGHFWNGSIDELHVYSRALSGAEITALMNQTGATPTAIRRRALIY